MNIYTWSIISDYTFCQQFCDKLCNQGRGMYVFKKYLQLKYQKIKLANNYSFSSVSKCYLKTYYDLN